MGAFSEQDVSKLIPPSRILEGICQLSRGTCAPIFLNLATVQYVKQTEEQHAMHPLVVTFLCPINEEAYIWRQIQKQYLRTLSVNAI